jgi:hypothetical protein
MGLWKTTKTSVNIACLLIESRNQDFPITNHSVNLCTTTFRLQPSVKIIPEIISSMLRRPKREDEHVFPSNSEIKNAWSSAAKSLYTWVVWLLGTGNLVFILPWAPLIVLGNFKKVYLFGKVSHNSELRIYFGGMNVVVGYKLCRNLP